MAKLSEIEEQMLICEHQLFKMCKVRTDEQRHCALSRCCGICPQVLSCKGVCKYLKSKFTDLGIGD